jgi:hypothetical protein
LRTSSPRRKEQGGYGFWSCGLVKEFSEMGEYEKTKIY